MMKNLIKIEKTSVIHIVMIPLILIALSSCKEHAHSQIFGTYRLYSDDPSVQMWIAGENTYLQLLEDHTIVYNNTLNGKPKFHFKGEFTFNEKTNTLNIKWKEGNLPDKLTVEKKEPDYVIHVGTTAYKKEKAPAK